MTASFHAESVPGSVGGADAPQALTEGFRLSPQQLRLWLLERSGEALLNVGCRVRIEGDLDPDLLGQAVRAAVKRHEILRTTFGFLPGLSVPVQRVHQEAAPHVETVDWCGLAPEDAEGRLDQLLTQLSLQPFDLEHGPLLRLILVALRPSQHALLICQPALCTDTAGLQNLVAEIARSYAALSGEPVAEDEPLQYADFAEWQNQSVGAEEMEPERQWWRRQDFSQGLLQSLPCERPVTARRRFEPRTTSLRVDVSTVARCRALASSQGQPFGAFLLACWQAFLWRHLGASPVVACCFDGRSYEELRGALGVMQRHLPVRCEVEGNSPLEQLLVQTGQAFDEASRVQEHFSWDSLSSAPADPAPFFLHAFELSPLSAFAAGGLFWKAVRTYGDTERYHLKLAGRDLGDAVALELVYDSAVIEREDAKRLARGFSAVLASAVALPASRPVRSLDFLAEDERQRLVLELNAIRRDWPHDVCLHDLIERQAEQTPDRTAVIFAGQAMTFRELDAQAGLLAHRLRALGAGPEVLVAVCLERSLEMVVGLLGVLKAGAAYLPLDPDYPRERLAFFLESSKARLLLTTGNLAQLLPQHGISVIRLDEEWRETRWEEPVPRPVSAVTPDNLAYVIYTSGSTGRPKGVQITHRAILNRLLWMQEEVPLGSADRVLQKTPFSFDASVWEVFLPLMTGAALVVAAPGGHQDPEYLVNKIVELEVTILQVVPSLLRMLLEQKDLERCCSLRLVFSGGEALPTELKDRLLARLPVTLYNLYGPTEVSIDASFWRCSPDSGADGVVVPIGRPITNTRILLLDSYRELVPFGAMGEVYVGGTGLARGYLARPELTAEKFIPDPFAHKPGLRLYRTGDLGRYRSDGALEYLGRIDQQVKVRGFRIELEEIEAVLREHPAVREAVVVAREESPGDVRLAGFVTLGEGAPPAAELRQYLGERLPEHMVPAAITVIESMPRTPNGKLDRAALPAIKADLDRRQAPAPPRNATEELVLSIWASVLSVETVGIHDDFFDLGGHSLLATQVVVRLRDAFQIDLPLRALFEAPTVAQLATRVQALLQARHGMQVPPIVRVSREGELPLSYGQQRLWFIHQLDPESPAYNIPDAFFARGRLDIAALEQALSEIVRRHEVLRAVFLEEGGRPVQVITPLQPWRLPIIDLQGLEESSRMSLTFQITDQEIHRPFELSRGPLFRGCVLRLAAEEHVVVLAVHHIVSDGWSTGLLVREMVTLYRAFSQGKPSPLPELPIQYIDFAAWQRTWLQGEVLEGQLEYWRRHMAGAAPVLDLPFDCRRPAQQTFRGAYQAMSLPADLTGKLKQHSRQQGATLYMTLLAVFDALLARYTRCEDIIVGAPIANRTRVETEALIGFFVNTLVLRKDLSGDPPFQVLLTRVREVVLAASTFQDLPFDRLVEELQPDRELGRSPVFQVIFVLQNAPRQGLELPGLELRPSPVRHLSLQFDLDVTLWEQGETIGGGFVYSPDLFDQSTILRMIDHFHRLLESAVADPGLRLSELPCLSSLEREQLLLEWNDTQVAHTGPDFWNLFEEQVARTPDAVAVACEGESLSYGDLRRRADRVAWSLAEQLGPEGVVAVLGERGIDLLTAMLGIFKAGGVYLPLDPLYPDNRLAQVLGQSGAQVLLVVDPLERTLDTVLEGLPVHRRPVVTRLSELLAANVGESDSLPGCSPERLAYVIYTSGSTGLPKGAMVTHGGMLNHLQAKVLDLRLTGADAVAQTASQTFDISVWQFLTALLVGGRVEIFRDDVAHDPGRLLTAVESTGISVLETVPSLLRVALDEIGRAGSRPLLKCLRWLLVTGEALPPPLCARWFELYPQIPLLNAYGPTECSDDVTHAFITRPPDGDRASAPLGFPIVNTQIYILDSQLHLAPTGVPGELCVGGAGVGRGYLHEPDRTARVFTPDPFASTPGQRLYRTGDLARHLPDGSLEFLGRLDHQVKVHGFRIELGEIEAVLAQHPAVREAVVLAREDTPGQPRLVAYVCAEEDQSLPEREGGDELAVARWQELYEHVYSSSVQSERDRAINLGLWRSSFTGESLPEDEISECFEDSVSRILRLRPRNVLEIGCGTGLLLTRIAPHCDSYLGLDISAAVLADLGERVKGLPGANVTLTQRAAHELDGIEASAFDVVILNEVAQYFPSGDYLMAVLESALRLLRDRGTLFLGGLRSLPLLPSFHTAVQWHRAPDSLPVAQLRQRIDRSLLREKELTIDPLLFQVLRQHWPEITEVSIDLKGGDADNELTRYRYDVWLRKAGKPAVAVDVPSLSWEELGSSLESLEAFLGTTRPAILRLRGIPNARLVLESRLSALLGDSFPHDTVRDLKARLREDPERRAIQPQDLWRLGARLPYEVAVLWSDADPWSIDALLRRREEESESVLPPGLPKPEGEIPAVWTAYFGRPYKPSQEDLNASIRGFVEERLPAYMVPGTFVRLAGMPLTRSGKIDRKALPVPEEPPGGPDQELVPPSTPIEQILAGIWSEILGLERVGIRDDFFDAGGHSLLATQVLSRIRETFRVDLTVRVMFEATTIEQMAQVLIAKEPQPGQTEKIARALLKLKSMSAEKKLEMLQEKRSSREGARLA